MSIVVTKSPPEISVGPPAKKKIKNKKVDIGHISTCNSCFFIDHEYTYVLAKNGESLTPMGVIPSDQLIKKIQDSVECDTGIMANDTIYFRRKIVNSNTHYSIVLQKEPRLQAISTYAHHEAYDKILNNDGFEQFSKVALPYTQMFLSIEVRKGNIVLLGSYMTCTNKPVESMSDRTYRLPLSNIDSNQHICWGEGIDMSIEQSQEPNIAKYCKKLYRAFFNTDFTNDYGYPWPSNTFRNMKEWEEVSAKEDGLIQCAKAGYKPGSTVEQLIGSI